MHLSRVRIGRLPGLAPSFTVEFQPGVNLLVGPNGSGKSSLTRAVFQLLWPDLDEIQPFEITAEFTAPGRNWQAEALDCRNIRWRQNGDLVGAPGLPGKHLAPSYKLGLLHITPAGVGADDQLLARQIRKEMDGGFDLDGTAKALFAASSQVGRSEKTKHLAAAKQVQDIQTRYRELSRRERTLESLKKERNEARLARGRADVLAAVRRLAEHQAELGKIEADLSGFPPGLPHVSADHPQDLARWRLQEEESSRKLASLETQLGGQRVRQEALAWPESEGAPFSLALLGKQVGQLQDLWEKRSATRIKLGGAHRAAGGEAPAGPGPAPSAVDRKTYAALLDLHHRLLELDARATALKEQLAMGAPAGSPWPLRALLLAGLGALAFGTWRVWSAGQTGATDPTGLMIGVAGGLLAAGSAYLVGRRRPGRDSRPRDLLQTLAAEKEQVLDQRQRLAERHQLDLENPSLFGDLKELEKQLDSQQEQRRIQGELDQLDRDCTQALAGINQQLALVGFGPVGNRTEAAQAHEDLAQRAKDLEILAGEINVTRVGAAAEQDKQAQAREAVAGIFKKLKLDPDSHGDDEVARLAGMIGRWKELQDAAVRTRGSVGQAQQVIDAGSGLLDIPLTLSLSPSELTAQLAAENEKAAQLEGLIQEIATITSELKAARGSDSLASAMEIRDRRLEELAAKRDQARQSALGRMLLGQVRRQSESRSRPAVLNQSMALFSEFTGYRYELQVAGSQDENQGGFRAREVETGQIKELDQLSDGTRAQLLLAVRLGFIFQTESDERPPLFLDDSLTSSDPARFAAVAASLGLLARKLDRQVIYLTANPVDGAAWNRALAQAGLPEAHTVDLALIRSLTLAAPAERLDLPELPETPSPEGLGAAAYAASLHVPQLNPWAAPAAAHLYYLLTDQLDLLHRLLEAGAPTAGRWLQARAKLLSSGVVSADQAAVLDIRWEVWSSVQTAWRVGRGMPVTMAAVDASGAVTGTMRDRVAEVLAECGGSGPDFISALREGQVKRFHESKKDQLQEFLELEGYLDSRKILDADGLVQQVVGDLAHRIKADLISIREIRSLVQGLAAYLTTPRS